MSENESIEKPWRVLCVDDDAGILRLYARIFAGDDWELATCQDGEAAVSLLQQQFYELIVLDVVMPGLTGIDVCALVREQPAAGFRPVVIMISGSGSEDAIETGFAAGADDYLVKPFTPTELIAKAKRCLRARLDAIASPQAHGELAPGVVVAERYRLDQETVAGGYSLVYRAFDVVGQRTVAVKFYDLPLPARSASASAGFLREAYQLSRLHHPNVVELYDFGRAEGFFYMAMEYVDGYNLGETVKRRGILDVPMLALVCYEVVQALAAMAEHGIVHRDVKPANIMISRGGDVKIIDFGLARSASDGTLSLADEFQGTPHFVPPEMIRGDRKLDERSDLYSLGATLYFAATGAPPYQGTSNYEILESHLTYVPPPLCEVRDDFDLEFSNLIEQMLAVDADSRPDCAYVAETMASIFKYN